MILILILVLILILIYIYIYNSILFILEMKIIKLYRASYGCYEGVGPDTHGTPPNPLQSPTLIAASFRLDEPRSRQRAAWFWLFMCRKPSSQNSPELILALRSPEVANLRAGLDYSATQRSYPFPWTLWVRPVHVVSAGCALDSVVHLDPRRFLGL